MKTKGNFSISKWLLVVLVIFGLTVIFLSVRQNRQNNLENPIRELKNQSQVKVRDLTGQEVSLGTILYPNAQITPNGLANKISLTTTDSVDGVIGIYSQDLYNRYPDHKLIWKTETQKDALKGQAEVLISSNKNEKIVVSAWPTKDGLTTVEVQKTQTF